MIAFLSKMGNKARLVIVIILFICAGFVIINSTQKKGHKYSSQNEVYSVILDFEKDGEIISIQPINEYEEIIIIKRYSALSIYKVTNNNNSWNYSHIEPLTAYETNDLNYIVVKYEFASSDGEDFYIYLGKVFNDSIEKLVSEDSSVEFDIIDSFVISEITSNAKTLGFKR